MDYLSIPWQSFIEHKLIELEHIALTHCVDIATTSPYSNRFLSEILETPKPEVLLLAMQLCSQY